MKNKTLIIFIAMLTGLLFPGLIATVQGNDCCRDGKLKVADGYEYEVIVTGLRRIDNIARIPNGNLVATLEIKYPEGRLVHINREGRISTLLRGLNKPDGLRVMGDKLFIVEEADRGRLIEYHMPSGMHTTIAELNHPEGLAIISDEELIVTEDKIDGKLLRVTRSGDVQTMKSGLNRPEGVVVDKHGNIYIAETGSGSILLYKNGTTSTIVEGLNEPDQLAIDHNGALWITEDFIPGRLIRYQHGVSETIVNDLVAPQGIMIDGEDILVAEQAWGRVVRIKKK